jgi:hypothetical protein
MVYQPFEVKSKVLLVYIDGRILWANYILIKTNYLGAFMLKVMASCLVILSSINYCFGSAVTDLDRLEENLIQLKKLKIEYSDNVGPILDKLKTNPDYILDLDEASYIKDYWTIYMNYRVSLVSLYNTYAGENSQQDILIKYTSNLHLNSSGAFIVKELWDNKVARKTLNDLNKNEIPQGSLISIQNSIFKQINKAFADEEIPTLFPVYNLEKDYVDFMNITGSVAINEDIENLNQAALDSLEALKPFFSNSNNISTAKVRWMVYKFKNIFVYLTEKIGRWLGKTKVHRRNPDYYNGQTYIDIKLAAKMEEKLKPGDIMLSKTDWFLSNLFFSGFFSHSFIYLDNKDELEIFFNDPEINDYFVKRCHKEDLDCYSLSGYLSKAERTAKAWKSYIQKDKYGFPNVLLEATGAGTNFNSIRKAFLNDNLAAIRPKVSKLDKAIAIVKSISLFGKEYDFEFDVQTEDKVFCSEVVLKGYLPGKDMAGINFNYSVEKKMYVENVLKRPGLPVINIVRKMYDENVRGLRASQFDFVGFLKGNSKTKTAEFKNEIDLFKTLKKPKWSFME